MIKKYLLFPWQMLKALDRRVDGAIVFFFRHWGKGRFMVSMSKRAQVLGAEELFNRGPKAFLYFFLLYLLRDTILYIVIPIFFARHTSN
jgi:hypothetical protein